MRIWISKISRRYHLSGGVRKHEADRHGGSSSTEHSILALVTKLMHSSRPLWHWHSDDFACVIIFPACFTRASEHRLPPARPLPMLSEGHTHHCPKCSATCQEESLSSCAVQATWKLYPLPGLKGTSVSAPCALLCSWHVLSRPKTQGARGRKSILKQRERVTTPGSKTFTKRF